MEQAALFSSLEHAISFARDLWFNKLPINSWLDEFATHMHIVEAVSKSPESIMKTRYENSFIVELEIMSRKEFILIERKIARLWERLSRDKIQETSEETGEIVQYSVQEEDVVPDDSSNEVVFT
ncbi:uncharacterized protein LOC107642039 [Arachis ipaensis]|uniref:uncharacterized protein LOC107642039 n=1 Tax=Arachis ipaensis TaxID=130454 RepID=UPI0007AEFD37|nr:uncharacterized protein LOC107642039 [Arachis ipaensis]QHO12767.1 Transthyretin domain-containing protein/OHCU_decarbox domain-containing protein [Arachis hypogaea]